MNELEIVSDKFEDAQISSDVCIRLPQLLCDNFDIFCSVINKQTWSEVLSETQRDYLKKFLPCLANQDLIVETLFEGRCSRFGQDPLKVFHDQLKNGYFRPDIFKLKEQIKREKLLQERVKMKLHKEKIVKDIVVSKQRVFDFFNDNKDLNSMSSLRDIFFSNSRNDPVNQCTKLATKSNIESEANTIFRNEIKSMHLFLKKSSTFSQIDIESSESEDSSDISSLNSICPTKPSANSKKRKMQIDSKYRLLLLQFEKRKRSQKLQATKMLPKPTISEICKRANFDPNKKKEKESAHAKNNSNENSNLLVQNSVKRRKINKVTSNNSKSIPPIQVFSTVESSGKADNLNDEEHSNFLILLRDVICSTAEQRMTFGKLESYIQMWQEKCQNESTESSGSNQWMKKKRDWPKLLGSALGFLCGECPNYSKQFVPYVEYKPKIEMYQWIGAGRDADSSMSALFKFWLENCEKYNAVDREQRTLKQIKLRKELESLQKNSNGTKGACFVESSSSSSSLSMTATNTVADSEERKKKWSFLSTPELNLSEMTDEKLRNFHEQERYRYENPAKSFTFRLNNQEFPVAPVRGVIIQNILLKNRNNLVLSEKRPKSVNILTLIRDAVARLPNGEGTRSDIFKQLRLSQYILATIDDVLLQNVLISALDRLSSEFDACVQFDSVQKCWRYLHKSRTEKEHETKHRDFVASMDPKKLYHFSKSSFASATDDCVTSSSASNSYSAPATVSSLPLASNATVFTFPATTTATVTVSIPITASPPTYSISKMPTSISASATPIFLSPVITVPTINSNSSICLNSLANVSMPGSTSMPITIQADALQSSIIHIPDTSNIYSSAITASPSIDIFTPSSTTGPTYIQIEPNDNKLLMKSSNLLQSRKHGESLHLKKMLLGKIPDKTKSIIKNPSTTSISVAKKSESQCQLKRQQNLEAKPAILANQRVIYSQSPIVAKLITNSNGQVISVENLLAATKVATATQMTATAASASTSTTKTKITNVRSSLIQNSSLPHSALIKTLPKNAPNVTQQFTILDMNMNPNPNPNPNQNLNLNLNSNSKVSIVSGNVNSFSEETSPVLRLQSKSQTGLKSHPVLKAKIINASGSNLAIGKFFTIPNQQIVQNTSLVQNTTLNQSSIKMANRANISSINGQNVIIQQKVSNLKTVSHTNTSIAAEKIIISNRSQFVTVATTQTTQPIVINAQSFQPEPKLVISDSAVSKTVSNQNQIVKKLPNKNQQLAASIVYSSAQPVLHSRSTPAVANASSKVVVKMAQKPQTAINRPVQNKAIQAKPIILTNDQLNQLLSQQIFVPANFTNNAINVTDMQGFKIIPVSQSKGAKQILASVTTVPKSNSSTSGVPTIRSSSIKALPNSSTSSSSSNKCKFFACRYFRFQINSRHNLNLI